MRRTFLVILLLGCVVAQAQVGAQLRTRVHASGLTTPVAFVQDPTDRNVQFVVQQNGRIRVVRAGAVLPADFLDLSAEIVSGGEQGLLGLAFAPNYATSRRFFVFFTNRQGNIVVSRFRRSDNPVVADSASRFDLRWNGANGPAFIFHPFGNHNAGQLVFGPDGFLYVGQGDGGAASDPGHRAQNPSELLGKMLRIDVNVGDDNPVGYRIPPDNPFLESGPAGTRPEIWAFGLRNPWRYTFDDPARGGTGGLVIGDVGQNLFEEIDYEPRSRGGRNYGWRNREGAHDHVTSLPPAFQPLTEPIHEYDRSIGASITGGYVYRGAALGSQFQGRYFFADFVLARVFSIGLTVNASTGEATASARTEHTSELNSRGPVGGVSSFGTDTDGELFLVAYSNGSILKIVGPPVAPPQPTGLRILR